MATLMNMPCEIWLMITDHMDAEDLARLSRTCKDAQAIAEERLYRQYDLGWLISWTLKTRMPISTLEKLLRYRKAPDGREWFIDGNTHGIPPLIDAALQKNGLAVDLLLNNGFVITKNTILNLLRNYLESLIIETLVNGAMNGYDMLVTMMVDCISDMKDIEVPKGNVVAEPMYLKNIFTAASLDRPEITKSVLSILPREHRQTLLYKAMTRGVKGRWLDDDRQEKAVGSLLAHIADPRSDRRRLSDQEALLESAAERGCHEIVSRLLQAEKFNSCSRSRRRAWRIAKNEGHDAVLQALFPERRFSQRQLSRQSI